MIHDYKKIWWNRYRIHEDEFTFKDLAIGLMFCALILGVSMAAIYLGRLYCG